MHAAPAYQLAHANFLTVILKYVLNKQRQTFMTEHYKMIKRHRTVQNPFWQANSVDIFCPSVKAKVKGLYFREKAINHKSPRENCREIFCEHNTLISYNNEKNSLVHSLSNDSSSYIKFLVNILLYVMWLAKTTNVNKNSDWLTTKLFLVYREYYNATSIIPTYILNIRYPKENGSIYYKYSIDCLKLWLIAYSHRLKFKPAIYYSGPS